MNDLNFVDRVKNYFDYLVSEYGFRIEQEKISSVRPHTDGAVEYISDIVGVLIDSETGYAGVRLYRIKDGKKYYITPVDIYEYLNTNDKEKELLLSTDPTDKSPASILFKEKFLLNQPSWKGSHGTIQDLDNELRNFSNWLKQNARLCLEGDLSWWTKFYEYKVSRARADHLRRGEDELGYAQVKGTDGKWKLIKQSIFKDQLEHVEKLKEEYQHK